MVTVTPPPTEDDKEKSSTRFPSVIQEGFVMAWEKQTQKVRLLLCSRGHETAGEAGGWAFGSCTKQDQPISPLKDFCSQRLKNMWQKLHRIQMKTESHKAHHTALKFIPNSIKGPIRSLSNWNCFLWHSLCALSYRKGESHICIKLSTPGIIPFAGEVWTAFLALLSSFM